MGWVKDPVRGLALNGRRISSFFGRKCSEVVLWVLGRRGGGKIITGEPSLGEGDEVTPRD